MTAPPRRTAVVAKRADEPPIDTQEIRDLVEAAGYEVVAACTQVRPEDPGTHLGRGKVDELVETIANLGADLVVIDGEVTAGQARNLSIALPDHVELADRYRLVLDIFAQQATTPRAAKQIELARLEYHLEWYEAVADESPLVRMSEKGSPRYQLEDRITALRSELASLPDPTERMRERRREEGFDLVTIAGYTNAGKSTLLRRLADDLTLEADTDHPDQDSTAAVEDRLFKTLETTTRRATLRGRPVLCTDTVGYVSELPHDLVVSFAETLSEAGAADVVVLVTDATDDRAAFIDKLEVSLDVLETQSVAPDTVLPVLNKIDAVDGATVKDRHDLLADHLETEVVPISARSGDYIDRLVDAILDQLPTEIARLSIPYGDEAMSIVSDAYDRLTVDDVSYEGDHVLLEVSGRPSVVATLRREVEAVTPG